MVLPAIKIICGIEHYLKYVIKYVISYVVKYVINYDFNKTWKRFKENVNDNCFSSSEMNNNYSFQSNSNGAKYGQS